MITAAELSRMSRSELDDLPYGAIRLTPFGGILNYNATEGNLAGRDPESVVGLNFFRDVAPCTDVKEFHGRFVEMLKADKSFMQSFEFEFAFERPLTVQITFLRDRGNGSVWVLVEPV